MNSAEFRLIRSLLGSSRDELADYFHVNSTSVLRWESGKYTIPDNVAQAMRLKLAMHNTALDLAINEYTSKTPADQPVTLTLWRSATQYKKNNPTSQQSYGEYIAFHAQLYKQLTYDGYTVIVNYYE